MSDEQTLRSQFQLLDRDNNGEVTAAELLQTVTELGLILSDEEVDEIMRVTDMDGNGKIEFEEMPELMSKLGKLFLCQPQRKKTTMVPPQFIQAGVADMWNRVDHVAIIVSDVARSSAFYGGKLGMVPIVRPDFDRFGAWFAMGNINLHLIKGRPAVHGPDDLIVSHIALDVRTEEKMNALITRLDSLAVPYRENISVPNPTGGNGAAVKQAFVQDPDGYYLEFCSCKVLEDYLDEKMAEYHTNTSKTRSEAAEDFRKKIASWKMNRQMSSLKFGEARCKPDAKKLGNLVLRQSTYGDITQSATVEQLLELLATHSNSIPEVIKALMERARSAGGRTYQPPAFYERDEEHTFFKPPTFKMEPSQQEVEKNK